MPRAQLNSNENCRRGVPLLLSPGDLQIAVLRIFVIAKNLRLVLHMSGNPGRHLFTRGTELNRWLRVVDANPVNLRQRALEYKTRLHALADIHHLDRAEVFRQDHRRPFDPCLSLGNLNRGVGKVSNFKRLSPLRNGDVQNRDQRQHRESSQVAPIAPDALPPMVQSADSCLGWCVIDENQPSQETLFMTQPHASGLSSQAILRNSPITQISYRRTRRLRFLFAALRTRSMLAREELARIASGGELGFETLMDAVAADPARVPANSRRLRAFADLAWLLHNQGLNDGDLRTAAQMYRFASARFGAKSVKQMHLADQILLGLRIEDAELVAAARPMLRSTFSWLPAQLPARLRTTRALGISETLNTGFVFGKDFSVLNQLLLVDADNPFRDQPDALEVVRRDRSVVDVWLQRLSKHTLPRQLAPIRLSSQPQLTPYDSLEVDERGLRPMTDGPLLTVVVSCFKPDRHLITSVQSILRSTYQNLEVLVIDDASGPEYRPILEETGSLDSRVRVLAQPQNGGTYRIRNRALDEAAGELITFNDSDDWMHPQRLELQAKRLIGSDRIANISMSTRITERLEAVESGRRLRIGLCEPSLMFWRERAVRKVGYFDKLRKGGDSEYRWRLSKAFGQDLEVIYPFRCLTLQRADNGGLTQGDLGFRWIIDFRLAFRDSYSYWHRKAGERLYNPSDETRVFYAPRPMRFQRGADDSITQLDLVFAANFCDSEAVNALLPELNQAIEAGKNVGLLQLATMYPLALTRTLRPKVLDLLNAGKVRTVYRSDRLNVAELRVLSSSAWLSSYSPASYNWVVQRVEYQPLSTSRETWVAAGDGLADLVPGLLQATFRPALETAPRE